MNKKLQDPVWREEYDRQLICVAREIGRFLDQHNTIEFDEMRAIAEVRTDRSISNSIPDGSKEYIPLTEQYLAFMAIGKFFYINGRDYFFSKFIDENLARLWHDHQPKNFYQLAVKMGYLTPREQAEWVTRQNFIAAFVKETDEVGWGYDPTCDCEECETARQIGPSMTIGNPGDSYRTGIWSSETREFMDLTRIEGMP